MSLHDTEYSKRLKDIFRGMKRRCYNPNNKAYQYYGAKGITICQEWLDDPTLFYQWSIENGYYDQDSNTCRSDLLSIDRIDPNGNYTPDNCQWVTVAENSGKDKGIYITVNKNAIHKDPEKKFVTSGIRIGTPAVTTRGLGVEEMDKIAEYIYLCATDFENKADEIRAGVTEICNKFPLYE